MGVLTRAPFRRYDFNKPDEIPAELHHTFTMVVIDPPFITQEVCIVLQLVGVPCAQATANIPAPGVGKVRCRSGAAACQA